MRRAEKSTKAGHAHRRRPRGCVGGCKHALDQLVRAEGFGDVVVGADLAAELLIDLPSLCGEQDDGDVLGGGIVLDHAAGLVAVELRHHDVEDDEVGLLVAHLLQGLLAVGRGDDVVALRTQDEIQDMEDVHLVVDHQDLALIHPRHFVLPCCVVGRRGGRSERSRRPVVMPAAGDGSMQSKTETRPPPDGQRAARLGTTSGRGGRRPDDRGSQTVEVRSFSTLPRRFSTPNGLGR